MKCPAQLYTASPRRYDGLPELTYPFHDRDILVTACGAWRKRWAWLFSGHGPKSVLLSLSAAPRITAT
jgi:hypothetical protein